MRIHFWRGATLANTAAAPLPQPPNNPRAFDVRELISCLHAATDRRESHPRTIRELHTFSSGEWADSTESTVSMDSHELTRGRGGGRERDDGCWPSGVIIYATVDRTRERGWRTDIWQQRWRRRWIVMHASIINGRLFTPPRTRFTIVCINSLLCNFYSCDWSKSSGWKFEHTCFIFRIKDFSFMAFPSYPELVLRRALLGFPLFALCVEFENNLAVFSALWFKWQIQFKNDTYRVFKFSNKILNTY